MARERFRRGPTSSGVWAMVMLLDDARDVAVSEIRRDLLRHLTFRSVFFPASTPADVLAWDHAMAHYVFVEVDVGTPVERLQRSRYVAEVVRTADRQAFELLNEAQMAEMRRSARPRSLRKDRTVRIMTGPHKGFVGVIERVVRGKSEARVRIRLHSRNVAVAVSLQALERV